MKYVAREQKQVLRLMTELFPSVVITGPRRSGKTTFLRRSYPKIQYVLLEDPDVQLRVRSDPRGFLDSLTPPVLLDEIQNTPELFAYIRSRIDQSPRRKGRWFFTGSQEAPLMQGVTESMAGRAGVLQLFPMSHWETDAVSPLLGGFPEVLASPAAKSLWFSSYLQTYLERDVRAVLNVKDISVFRRFLSILAARHGQVLNRSEIGAQLGLSVPTISSWLGVLEITGQVILVPPYWNNFGKRLIKSPKIYIADSGMACHLLGIRTQEELERSPFLGVIFEGFIASEILKSQLNKGLSKDLYFFRDQQGLEVDFLAPHPGGLWFVECKASRTVVPQMARPVEALRKAVGRTLSAQYAVVYRSGRSTPPMRTLTPGVQALTEREFIRELR